MLYCISVEIMVWTRARARALRLALRCVRGQHRSGTKFRSHLRQACPVDDEEFPRMSLKTLASLLMGMSKTRCPHCRLYRTGRRSYDRTIVSTTCRNRPCATGTIGLCIKSRLVLPLYHSCLHDGS